jgi:alkanesulfonate monooxygenase
MEIKFGDKPIRTFTISPRTLDVSEYWGNIEKVVQWSEKYGHTGVLLFEGNDTLISPWIAAHEAVVTTKRISPLVAVNPLYMHPFSVAKMVSSIALLHGRKVFLNMITGTALNYLQALSDKAGHNDRYERLREYTVIIRKLLESTRPVTFQGRYYQVENLVLPPGIPEELFPEFLVSGQSDSARKVCRELGGIGLQMLQPGFAEGLDEARAIHFGIVTRDTEAEAWSAAEALFPEDEEGQAILEYSMQNTDSVWKRRMMLAADEPDRSASGYWLAPFRNFKADCPYIVGSYDLVGEVLASLVIGGIEMFVLNISVDEEEFVHIQRAFKLAMERLQSPCEAPSCS